jgi:hypothetical protein
MSEELFEEASKLRGIALTNRDKFGPNEEKARNSKFLSYLKYFLAVNKPFSMKTAQFNEDFTDLLKSCKLNDIIECKFYCTHYAFIYKM